MDNLSTSDRKKNMTNIKSKGARSTEKKLRNSLAGAGISGFKLNDKTLPGTPDFVFLEDRLAIFVDGCFWHGCPKCYKRPKSNQQYWDKKYTSNKIRDEHVDLELNKCGWTVLRLWEHELKEIASVRARIQELLE